MKYTKEDLFVGMMFALTVPNNKEYDNNVITILNLNLNSIEIKFNHLTYTEIHNYSTIINIINGPNCIVLNPKMKNYEIF